MTMLADEVDVVIGVDTHKHTHTAVATSATGGGLGEATVATDLKGYRHLLSFARRWQGRRVWAIEGAGGYGAGLYRFLTDRGERIVELDRPGRPARRGGAKSDPIDALRAAREALSRDHQAQPRQSGPRDALRVLLAARRSAVQASGDAQRQLHNLVVCAPEELRARLRHLGTKALVARCARMRRPGSASIEAGSTIAAMRSLAQRIQRLEREAKDHENTTASIVRSWRPELLELLGVGPVVAAVILCSWSHPGRFRSEAAFANLAGVAPIPASSGLVNRHRLNRAGDRQLNRAFHTIVVTRLRLDPETQAYAARRLAEGKSMREVRRCLKRYVAREVFRLLEEHRALKPSTGDDSIAASCAGGAAAAS